MIVYIVHCIDAEGPMYESIEATFKRIHNIFEIDLEPTYENITKLRNGNNKAIIDMISTHLLDYKDTWDKIDQMLDEITSKEFRNKLKDSFGGGWKYNWFCIDWVGFFGENPRRKDIGFHNIFDHYRLYNKLNEHEQDDIQFHYHGVPLNGHTHIQGTSYSSIIYEILARRIIDRLWFPTASRSVLERPDSHWFHEQWIPFSYGNGSMKKINFKQPDLSDGRMGDWRYATNQWEVYHPSHDDYQNKGNCHRWIGRCLNMRSRIKDITIDDFREGFERASLGLPTLISFANHDFRNMKREIDRVRNMIQKVSEEYPNIKFKYCNSIEAMRKVIGISEIQSPHFSLNLKKRTNSSILKIISRNRIFGTQPFFAIKTKSSQYIWQNLDYQEGHNKWSYTFDFCTLPIEAIEKIGIAANSIDGTVEVVVLDIESEKIKRKIYNER